MTRGKPDGGGLLSGDRLQTRPRALTKLNINYLMDEGLMKAGCEVVVAGYDAPPNGRYWGNSGQKWILVRDGLSAFDPTATLAVHCGNRFDAGFSPYQSASLSRYNPAS
jgi:hypothetical protein